MQFKDMTHKIIIENKSLQRIMFIVYSYLKNIETLLLFIFPSMLTLLYFKVVLHKVGSKTFIDHGFYFRYGSKIDIGNNVEINRNCSFYPSYLTASGKIHIGDNSILAPGVSIYAAGQDRNNHSEHTSGDVHIGQNVYIGANSIIRYGVTVGDNATIAIGSVIVKSVPANTTVGGNPAKILF
jgi:maltose O-acetyltransferase